LKKFLPLIVFIILSLFTGSLSVGGLQKAYGGGIGFCEDDFDCGFFDVCIPGVCDTQTNTCVPGPPIPECCADDFDCEFFDVCIPGACDQQTNTCVPGPPIPECCADDFDCEFFDVCIPGACDQQTNICLPGDPIPECCASDSDCGFFDVCIPEVCDLQTNICLSGDPIPGCFVEVGGELIPLDTTSLILAGTQTTVSWLIPVTVSAIGIAIVIARKFSKYQPV